MFAPAVAANPSQNTSTSCVSNVPIAGTGYDTGRMHAARPPRSTAAVTSASSIGRMQWP